MRVVLQDPSWNPGVVASVGGVLQVPPQGIRIIRNAAAASSAKVHELNAFNVRRLRGVLDSTGRRCLTPSLLAAICSAMASSDAASKTLHGMAACIHDSDPFSHTNQSLAGAITMPGTTMALTSHFVASARHLLVCTS